MPRKTKNQPIIVQPKEGLLVNEKSSDRKEAAMAVRPAQTPEELAIAPPPDILQRYVDDETARRKILKEYIAKHLVAGVDYGPIHVVSKDKCTFGNSCKTKSHFSKDVLFKSGSEKFVSLFKLSPRFERDIETLEMLKGMTGLIAFVCKLYSANGVLIAEGRGSSTMTERTYGWTPNNAIKMAEKRAQLDAVLRMGALSDYFTQDLEDQNVSELPTQPDPVGARTPQNTPQTSINQGVPTQTRGNPPPARTPLKTQVNEYGMINVPGISDRIPPISEKQIKYVMVLANQIGDDQERSRTHAFIKSAFKKEHLKQLNIEEAGTLITKLQEKVKQVQEQAETVQLDAPVLDAPSGEDAMDEALRKALDI